MADKTRAETEDAYLGGRVMVMQPASGYRAGLDAVLLAAAVPIRAGARERVADFGAGVGVAGLCLAARVADARITLIEREPALLALARNNIARNGMNERVQAVALDIAAPAADFLAADLAPDSFDHCLANPPFGIQGQGRRPKLALKAAAHEMPEGALDDWLRAMARLLRAGGTLTLVHRADALVSILATASSRFGALAIRPIHSHAGEPAIRVLVTGIKGSRAPLSLLPGLVLHAAGGGYRPEIEVILRAPVALAPP